MDKGNAGDLITMNGSSKPDSGTGLIGSDGDEGEFSVDEINSFIEGDECVFDMHSDSLTNCGSDYKLCGLPPDEVVFFVYWSHLCLL